MRPMRPVLGEGRALDHDAQPLEALGRDGGIDEAVDHGRPPRCPAGREDERVGAVVLGGGDDLERALEVVVGLAGEADDDVGRHRQIGNGGAGRRQPLEVALGGVAAVHRGQHAIGAGLQRVVQVLAHAGVCRPWRRTSRAACPWGAGW